MMRGGGGGDFDNIRDTFVSYLMSMIVDRFDKKKGVMLEVSKTLTQIERLIMRNDFGSRLQVKMRLQALTESKIVEAITVVAGDEDSLRYFIYCIGRLSNQLMRPSPRLKRTQQLFNDVKEAWHIACGYDAHNWENILQMNSAVILQEVPLIKNKGSGMAEFMARVRGVANQSNEEKKK
jgi:hypothetical protein